MKLSLCSGVNCVELPHNNIGDLTSVTHWIWTMIASSLDFYYSILMPVCWDPLSCDLAHCHKRKANGVHRGPEWTLDTGIFHTHHPWIWLSCFCPCSCHPGRGLRLWAWVHKTVKEGKRWRWITVVCYIKKLPNLYIMLISHQVDSQKNTFVCAKCNGCELFHWKLQLLSFLNVTHLSSTSTKWHKCHLTIQT